MTFSLIRGVNSILSARGPSSALKLDWPGIPIRQLSANPLAQGRDEFLPFPQRQVRQPVSFGETISFNLSDVWDKLPNVTVNKNATLGEIYDGLYTNYKFRKIYGVIIFAGAVFWLFHVK